jgi:hypothetical protein
MHRRLAPKPHAFRHAIFMCYLDLDELEQLARRPGLFGHNHRAVYAFRDADHLQPDMQPTKQKLLAYLHTQGIDADPAGRVMLLTLPRILGYIFNPISVYYCFRPDGSPLAAVAEVGNTFGEMKLFLLPAQDDAELPFHRRVAKNYYVSPFSTLELQFDFALPVPHRRLRLRIDDYDGDERVLASAVIGRRVPWSNLRLAWFALKYPLLTLKVIALIHWHALRLWLKRVPYHRKADHPLLQQGVLRGSPRHP